VPRPPDLPDYERPPIDEVAIGVQFVMPIAGFADAHAGVFWQTVISEYPKVEPQPRVESPPEVLDQPAGTIPLPFPLFTAPHGARTFLISEDDAYLLQIQNNRFYRNWRRRDEAYPHFDELEHAFRSCYASFSEFVSAEGLSQPVVRQIDVTYINWITDLTTAEFLRPGEPVDIDVPGVDTRPEDQSWSARYLVRDADHQPVGRLHVQCVPGMRATESGAARGVQMSMTFLAPCSAPPTDEALESLLAQGRNAIVRGFTKLTTPAAHEHWGRTQ
jgi:uncharacterized protein (TIGR04255 family)